MAEKGTFIIKRRDGLAQVDDVVVESEGLTIGRLITNDLVLNNRAVSRTHSGLKQLGNEYWVFNLSSSNGTILNGQLVARAPIADGDTLQIGPYVLRMNYTPNGLQIVVEMELQVQTAEGVAAATRSLEGGGGAEEGTLIIDMKSAIANAKLLAAARKPDAGTGLLTGVLPALDEQALNVFWEKRKREAGKIAEKTLLHPKGGGKVGKARFNWRPTLDLRHIWRKSYFYWGGAIVLVISAAAIFVPGMYYSPGDLSTAHSSAQPSSKGIAKAANGNSCSNCHTVTASMQQSCTACHTTRSFQPIIYTAHKTEGMQCTSCHSEHLGRNDQMGLISYGICSSCHNGQYRIKAGTKAGEILPIPHGGGVGYPVTNHSWTWKGLQAADWRTLGLPEQLASRGSQEQFHLVHQLGKMAGRMRCTDCHVNGTPQGSQTDDSPRGECAKCHGVTYAGNGPVKVTANCNTCHQQHGESVDLAKLVPPNAGDFSNIKKYITGLTTGGADNQGALPPMITTSAVGGASTLRQDRAALRLEAISSVGAVPWYGWLILVGALPVVGFVVMGFQTARRRSFLKTAKAPEKPEEKRGATTRSIDLEKLKAEGPPFPHPVIDPVLCIGCHACVEACPFDVLAIVNGVSTPVALDQCMEDTSCQVECPTSPKACIVINTTKHIPERKVPRRDQKFMTNAEGIYLIGDVSGVPLIKNAVNEGAQVIDYIVGDLAREGNVTGAEYDLAVIGIGPAGLSAAALAKQRGLTFVAIEQDQIVSTIQNYPAGKYVFYKPDTVDAKGGIPLPGVGGMKEAMLSSWFDIIKKNDLVINEGESCSDIKKEGSLFRVVTEKGKAKTRAEYRVRRVILAIGNRGTPMKLRVPGEELRVLVTPDTERLTKCPKCGGERREGQHFCPKCGNQFKEVSSDPALEPKVKYKLLDPDDYKGKHVMVVGAGNSAIECAVDLAGFKREGDSFKFIRDNTVTLVIRSDFKGDLKLGNKMNVYDCIDAGKIKAYYRATIKEIREKEVVLMDARSQQELATLPNDFVFALIGGEKPTKFLESLGIKVG